MRALADAQRLLEEDVEGRADGAVLLAEPQRLAGLAEDLALADDHRVEAGGDVEEVGDGALVVVDVEVRHERLGGLAGALDEQPGDVLDAAVEAVDLGVDLEPVAREIAVASVTCSPPITSSTSLVAPSVSSASRSSSATGADLWEIPTTRTLMPRPP